MKKMTSFAISALVVVLCSSFNTAEKPNSAQLLSEDLERTIEREMLNTIEYIEEKEEIDLGFDSYFYLPHGFNAYEGMEFELSDIEYIELED
ncbi:MAG: hypothetical protein AB8B59_01825 [Maribacter sp.]